MNLNLIPMRSASARILSGILVTLLASQSTAAQVPTATSTPSRLGIVVMAHGGDPAWNDAVMAATAPVAAEVSTAVAFGMADPHTLKVALDSLAGLAVERVAVVRMFLSGESFIDQTEYLLGLSETPPPFFIPGHGSQGAQGASAGPPASPHPIEHDLSIATHDLGMVDSPEAAHIFAERARSLSIEPTEESVLLIAHGMGDESDNDALLESMAAFERSIGSLGFHDVHSATLREDWPEARAIAEREIRAYVRAESSAGREVIVVPVRLSGFGPYGTVLQGLPYAGSEGLVPHADVAAWVRSTACLVFCLNGWGSPLAVESHDHDREQHEDCALG